jgi:hypothetical protein
MEKNVVKFGAGVIGLVAVGAAVFYGVNWYQERNSPEYAINLEYQKLLEAYKNDSYGGATPEETLQLFIDALKAGDTDLAAKYFVVEEREKEKNVLDQAKDLNKLTEVINRLQQFKLSKQDLTTASFVILDEKGVLKYHTSLVRNSNGKWKIIDL